MTREEQLKFCKVCVNKKLDFKRGIVCNLTGEFADFDVNCNDYQLDENEKAIQDSKPSWQHIDNVQGVNKSANWFYIIAFLSILNAFIHFFGKGMSFIFGLGITQFIEGVYAGIFGEIGVIGLIASIIVASIFFVIGYYSNKLNKTAFIIGLGIYIFDALLLLIFRGWLPLLVHIYIIYVLIKGYQGMIYLKNKAEI